MGDCVADLVHPIEKSFDEYPWRTSQAPGILICVFLFPNKNPVTYAHFILLSKGLGINLIVIISSA